jgi:hypothetical protein
MEVQIHYAISLSQAIEPHRALNEHHLGRIPFQPWLSAESV